MSTFGVKTFLQVFNALIIGSGTAAMSETRLNPAVFHPIGNTTGWYRRRRLALTAYRLIFQRLGRDLLR